MNHLTASFVPRSSRRVATAGLGLAAAACLLSLTGPARAVTTPLPYVAVSPTGDASQQPSGSGYGAGIVAPGGGSTQFLVTTESQAHDNATVSGTSAVPVAVLASDAFLDPASVSNGAGHAGTEGSALEFTLNIDAAHNGVSFNYNFATAEDAGQSDAAADFAFYSLTPVDINGLATGPTTYGVLGGATDAASGFSVINDPMGTSPFSFTEGNKNEFIFGLTEPRYVLAIGVADADGTDTQSGLFLSDVVAIPEPGVTTVLLLAGGGAACWVVRRQRGTARA